MTSYAQPLTGACHVAAPKLEALAKKHGDQLICMFLNIVQGGKEEEDFASKHGISSASSRRVRTRSPANVGHNNFGEAMYTCKSTCFAAQRGRQGSGACRRVRRGDTSASTPFPSMA